MQLTRPSRNIGIVALYVVGILIILGIFWIIVAAT